MMQSTNYDGWDIIRFSPLRRSITRSQLNRRVQFTFGFLDRLFKTSWILDTYRIRKASFRNPFDPTCRDAIVLMPIRVESWTLSFFFELIRMCFSLDDVRNEMRGKIGFPRLIFDFPLSFRVRRFLPSDVLNKIKQL
jgi:hypothetical protein